MTLTRDQIAALGCKWKCGGICTRNGEITAWPREANGGRRPTLEQIETWTAEYLAREKTWEEMNRAEQARVMNAFLATRGG